MYGNDWLKFSRAKTEHLQTAADTNPVRMKRYIDTEIVNLPTVQSFNYLGSTIGDKQIRGEQSDKGMVEMEKTEYSDMQQENSNKIEAPDISDCA